MSLVVTQRPSQTISNLIEKWNAVGNPVVYKMIRKDHIFNQVNNSGGKIQLQFNNVNISSSFSVGDVLWVQSDNGVYSQAGSVQTSTYSAPNTLITLNESYISAAPGGYTNNETKRENYYVAVEVFDEASVKITSSTYKYYPDSKGNVFMDISSILKSILKFENNSDYQAGFSVVEDVDAWTGFYIKYTETYLGSAQFPTVDSGNIFYCNISTLQILSEFGGNLYQYLIKSDMKIAEVDLTHSQILTGNSNPVDIIPAQGAGKIIIPISVSIKILPGGSAYTVNTGLELLIGNEVIFGTWGDILTQTSNAWKLSIGLNPATTNTSYENQPFKFRVPTGNPSGGHANTVLKFRVIYAIINI